QVKTAYNEITEANPAERIRLLEQYSEEVRAEVLQLLNASEDTGGADGLESISDLVLASITHGQAFWKGQILNGRFEIQRYLGGGGMGEVYAARDEILGNVALKTLRPEFADLPDMRDRFRREVMRGRSVAHPNVCNIYELLETEGQEPR